MIKQKSDYCSIYDNVLKMYDFLLAISIVDKNAFLLILNILIAYFKPFKNDLMKLYL